MGSFGQILPLILLGVVFYFLVIRPQRNRQKQQQAMIAALGPGAQVMTSSGIFATVVSATPEEMQLELAPGVIIRVIPSAVNRVISTPEPMDGPVTPRDDAPSGS